MRNTLALLLDHLVGDYSLGLYRGVRSACQQHDVNLLTFVGDSLDSNVPEGRARNAVYELARSERVDGVILAAGCLEYFCGPARFRAFCEGFHRVPRCCIGSSVEGVPSTLVDNKSGMRLLIEHLIVRHRFRRIAFVCGPDSVGEARERLGVYRDTLDRHGLDRDPNLILPGDFQIEAGAAAVRTLRARNTPFEAIVAANDNMALGALEELSRLGVPVPEAVAVAGFDDVPLSRVGKIALTTVRQPLAAQGRVAVETILTQLAGGKVPACVTLDAELVLRESCGCGFEVRSSRSRPSVPHPSAPPLGGKKGRDVFVELLADGFGELAPRAEALMRPVLDALQRHLDGVDSSDEFISGLSAALAELDAQEDAFDRFQRLLFATHARLEGGGRDEARRLSELLQRARIAVSAQGVRVLGRERMILERAIRALRQARARLATCVEEGTVMSEVSLTLPELGIRRAFLSDFESDRTRLRTRLWLEDARPRRAQDLTFSSLSLAPDPYFDSEWRFEHVVSALCAGEDVVGLALLEAGDVCPAVFGSIRDQLAASFKALSLHAARIEAVAGQQRAEQARLRSEVALAERVRGDLSQLGHALADLEVATSTSDPPAAISYADALPTRAGTWLMLGDVPVPAGAVGATLVRIVLQSAAAALADSRPEESPERVLSWIAELLEQNLGRRLGLPGRPQLTLLSVDAFGSARWCGPGPAPLFHRARTRQTLPLPADGATSLSSGDLLIMRSPALRMPFDEVGSALPFSLVTQVEQLLAVPVGEVCAPLLASLGAPQRGASLLVARYCSRGADPRADARARRAT